MRGFFLLAALLLSNHAFADSVVPRLGPLPILSSDGVVSGAVDIPFGERLTILSQDGAILTVTDATGQELQVRASDVIAAPKAGLSLMQDDQLAGSPSDRADLQLWESAFQLRVFLGGAGSNKFAPSMVIPAGTDLAKARLPVMSVDKADTSVGTPVTIVQALFPLLLSAIDPVGQGQGRSVDLHLLVDGSDYARPFVLETLRLLSRGLAEQPGLLGESTRFTRQVLYESGDVRDDGEVSVSGLRAEWTAEDASKDQIGLTVALSDALKGLVEQFDPADPVTHLVLILAGPGLSDDPDAMRVAQEAGDSLALRRADGVDVGGIVLLQGTPEPNPANDAVLATLAGGAQIKLVDFGAEVFSELAALATAKADASPAGSANPICESALSGNIPCLVPINPARFEGLSSAFIATQQANWVALPLWFVSETAPLDLVPGGLRAADVHAQQADIRACNAIGYVWDVSNLTCVPAGQEQGLDFYAQLIATQDEIAFITSQKDSAEEEFARKKADWQNEKFDLEAQLSSMKADRDAALVAINDLDAQVATQLAVISDAESKVSTQSDQISQFSIDAQTMKEDLLAAQARADELAATIESRDAELQAATRRLSSLGQSENTINEALALAQDQMAKLEKTVKTLTQSLDEERTAKAALEAKTAQLQADFQEKINLETARAAELETARAALSDSLEQERADRALAQTNAEKAIADLEKRIEVREANSAALQAQIADAQMTMTTLQDAKNNQSESLSNVEVKLIEPDWQNEKATLEALLLSAQQDSDAARASIAELENKVAAQLAVLSDAERKVSSQSDQLRQSAIDAQSLKDDLLAAQARSDDLSAAIESRKAELQVATTRIDALVQNENAINKAYAVAQDQMAKLEETVETLTQSLDEERAAKAEVEAKTAQLAADFQEKINLETARSAKLETARAALSESLKEERANSALAQTNTAQTIADLEKRIETSEANSTSLQAQIADGQAMMTKLEDEKKNLLTQFSIADAARLQAEQNGLETDKKLMEVSNKVISLQGLLNENTQQLAQVSTTLANERVIHEKTQAASDAEIAVLNEQVAGLAKTQETNGTLLAELDKTRSSLSTLQAQNALMAKANADALSNFNRQSEKAKTDLTLLQAEYDGLAGSSSAQISSLESQFNMAQSELASTRMENERLVQENEAVISKIKALSVKSNDDDVKLAQLNLELSTVRGEMERAVTQSTTLISELQSQVADLTRARADLTDQVSQMAADRNESAGALPVERDGLANQVSTLMLETTPSPQGLGVTEIKPVISADAATSLFADADMKRPQPRPADFMPIQSIVASVEQSKPSAPAITDLAPEAKPVTDTLAGLKRRTLKASALNGCHFEWTGQAGALVCP